MSTRYKKLLLDFFRNPGRHLRRLFGSNDEKNTKGSRDFVTNVTDPAVLEITRCFIFKSIRETAADENVKSGVSGVFLNFARN